VPTLGVHPEYPWIARANITTIAAKYEDGVFKPLEEVKLTEGTRVEVHVAEQPAPKPRKSVRDLPIFGMWPDRDDIPDGVTYVNRLREPRF